MKRFLSVLVFMGLLLSLVVLPVQATDSISPKVTVGDAEVTISGVEESLAGLPLTIKIVDEGGELEYLYQTQVAADGGYAFVIEGLKEGESYTYSMRHPRLNDFYENTLYISSATDAETVLEAFKDLNVSKSNPDRISDMTDFLTTPSNIQILNIDIEAFSNLENPDVVAEAMCDEHNNLTSVELIGSKFIELVRNQAKAEETAREDAALVKKISEANISDMLVLIEESTTRLGIKTKYGFATVKDNYENGDDVLAQSLKEAIKGAKTPNELNAAISGTLALVAFNNESWGKYDEIEKYFNEDIGSIFSNVKSKLTDIELTDLKKKVSKEIFDDLEKLKDFINKEAQEIIDNRKSSGSSSFGGDAGVTVVKDKDKPVDPENKPIAIGFTDLESVSWAKESIVRLKELGIVNGKSTINFAPNDKTTREEFLKMLLLSSGIAIDENAVPDFADVSASSWCAPYIKKAVDLGIVTGISDAEFGVGHEITRQDMAVLCYRMLSYLGKEMPQIGVNVFADESDISSYAKDAVNVMLSLGIVKGMGDNRFEPSVVATRAQTAVIIDRLMSLK